MIGVYKGVSELTLGICAGSMGFVLLLPPTVIAQRLLPIPPYHKVIKPDRRAQLDLLFGWSVLCMICAN